MFLKAQINNIQEFTFQVKELANVVSPLYCGEEVQCCQAAGFEKGK